MTRTDEDEENAVLAEIMRRILSADEGYVWMGESPYRRLTLDLSIEISAEELALLNEIGAR